VEVSQILHKFAWPQKLTVVLSKKHVIFYVFQCLQYDYDYSQLCATYSCRQSEQVMRRIQDDFDRICATKEA